MKKGFERSVKKTVWETVFSEGRDSEQIKCPTTSTKKDHAKWSFNFYLEKRMSINLLAFSVYSISFSLLSKSSSITSIA